MTSYPVIDDPDHPLYAEAHAGWPTLSPREAMRQAIEHATRKRGSSLTHPAFSNGAITNKYATRPEDDAKPAPTPEREHR